MLSLISKSQLIIFCIFLPNSNIEIFTTKYEVLTSKILSKKDKFLVFSGIGNADDFKKILIENKFKIIKEIIFPDHYQYKKKDIEKIKDLAKKMNAKIITSEKDYVKIKVFDNKNIKFLKVDLKIKNKNKLFNFIKSKLYEAN